MANKVLQTFRFDKELLGEFRRVAKLRGHTMTWYLEGCMHQVIGKPRREVIEQTKLFDLEGKAVKPLKRLTKSKRSSKKKSQDVG